MPSILSLSHEAGADWLSLTRLCWGPREIKSKMCDGQFNRPATVGWIQCLGMMYRPIFLCFPQAPAHLNGGEVMDFSDLDTDEFSERYLYIQKVCFCHQWADERVTSSWVVA